MSLAQVLVVNMLKGNPDRLMSVIQCPDLRPFISLDSILITNSSDVSTNLCHEIFPQIFLSLSSWKRKQTSYWSQTVFFPQFTSWKNINKKYSLKTFVYLEFEIGETIWWTTPMLRIPKTITNHPILTWPSTPVPVKGI